MRRRHTVVAILVAAATIVQAEAIAHAHEAPRPNLANLMHSVTAPAAYQEVAVSPDGRHLAWVQAAAPRAGKLDVGSEIYVAPVDAPTRAVRVTAMAHVQGAAVAPVHERALAWSHAGTALAFLSDARTPHQLEPYVWTVGEPGVRKLAQLKGWVASPSWSPDDHSLALLFTENAQREAGPLAAVATPTGVIGQQILEQRIAIVDVANGTMRQVSPADLYVYEYDWSPDGTRFVATAAHGSGDSNWYIAELDTIDARTGATHTLLKPRKQIAVPRWSPDGQTIAFVSGLMSDEGVASGDLHLIPADGGPDRNLTPNLAASVYWLAWLKDSHELVLAEALGGGSALARIDTRSGAQRLLWQAAETIRASRDFALGASLASDGSRSAVIRESFNDPPALWYGRIGAWQRFAPRRQPAVHDLWSRAESIRWQSDQFEVQGWLVGPASVDSAKRYPLIVWVHGGPAWLSMPRWPTPLDNNLILLLAARGYYVFFPNPRGSAGFGERFKEANVKDFGGGDLRDILAGIHQVLATHPIDDSRVGLTGWSYGGYMTMWALTQTTRFRAAVVGAGVADWLSYYGENGIDEWMLPYFGASVYDDPQVYAKSSPINFIKNVHTPTLIVVGDSDVECPTPQSYEYWHALRTLGVKTQLVVYPHEGHEFSDPAHTLDVLKRTLRWFDDNMPAAVHNR